MSSQSLQLVCCYFLTDLYKETKQLSLVIYCLSSTEAKSLDWKTLSACVCPGVSQLIRSPGFIGSTSSLAIYYYLLLLLLLHSLGLLGETERQRQSTRLAVQQYHQLLLRLLQTIIYFMISQLSKIYINYGLFQVNFQVNFNPPERKYISSN